MASDKPAALEDIVVGDRFWLAYAQEAVRGAVKAPEQRAIQLAGAIAWFWTVYSAAGLLAVALGGDRFGQFVSLLIALPSLVLIFAYWQTVRVGRPLTFNFDPRIPSEISSAFARAAEAKQSALRWAEILTSFAGLLVAVAVVSALLQSPASAPSLAARFDPDDKMRLLIVASVSKGAPVIFVARAASAPAGAASSASTLVKAASDGQVRTSLRVAAPGAQSVTATWSEDVTKTRLSMVVDVSAD
ncbi:hypothetical protein [Thauera sp. Sel9]|uniref:hypothetical protein n=1 Tax=Thauera sp. Sel9 TaxID=2974299 RepID=UPI0021E1289B|nr:hypothetical protein [Thauera sp. Sel9]MCV2218530.1 hypothetical protein [Thauera sp. Sel9]